MNMIDKKIRNVILTSLYSLWHIFMKSVTKNTRNRPGWDGSFSVKIFCLLMSQNSEFFLTLSDAADATTKYQHNIKNKESYAA